MEKFGVNIKDSQTQTGGRLQSKAPGGSGELCQRARSQCGETGMVPVQAALEGLAFLLQAEKPPDNSTSTGPTHCLTEAALLELQVWASFCQLYFGKDASLRIILIPPKERVMPGHSGKADVLWKGKSQSLYLYETLCN